MSKEIEILKKEKEILNSEKLKKMYGQFFTVSNPFKNNFFFKWYNEIDKKYGIEELEFLEPFAGENNIISFIQNLNLKQPKSWKCFDINKSLDNKVDEFKIEIRDTIKDFPKNYKVVITNPPYLAKNKATALKISHFDNNYEDLYMKCLDIMLKNVDYIAAIIPESFITSKKYQERLYGVISLEMRMFSDTDCPVCLALFNKNETEDFYIIKNNEIVGTYSQLKKHIEEFKTSIDWKFNSTFGNIGLIAVDNTREESIKFLKGEEIENEIKQSSRAITKISGLEFQNSNERFRFIEKLNKNLREYRLITNDVFLTSFKGLRKDLKYRRRLDYKTAKNILNKTYIEIYGE